MNIKIKLFTLFTTIAVLSFVIYQERFTLPSVNSAYASDDVLQELDRDVTVPNFDFDVFTKNTSSSLHKVTGDKIYIHFWASWCNVCTKEFEDIIPFAKKHPNATVLAISLDDEKDEMANYLSSIEKTHAISKVNNLLFIWDDNHAISQGLFNTTRVPETYLVNKDYKITNKTIGRADWR